ncbi:EF-hand domain-containing protein [Pycnococcus provasolii]
MTSTKVSGGEVREFLHGCKLEDLPESLRKKLARFDSNGNGLIEPSELPLTDAEDSISIRAFPKTAQASLAVFDKDNDGSVDVRELMHAADMYAESKKTSKRLTIFSGLLLLILCALVGVIVGLTAVVVEESKESKAESDGSLKKKGSSKDITVGTSTLTTDVFDSIGMPASSLSSITTLTLTVGTTTRSYTVTGFTKTPSKVTYNTPSGYSIVVTKDKYEIVNAATGKTVAETKKSGSRRRALLQAGALDTMKMTKDSNTNDAPPTCTSPLTFCENTKTCKTEADCKSMKSPGADNSTTVVCDALTGGEEDCESFGCEWYKYPASPNPIVSFCDEPNTPDEILCPKIMKKDDCDYLPHCKFGATCMAKTDNDRCQELTPVTCEDGIHMDDDHIDCKYDDTTAGPGKVIGCVHDHGDHHDHDHGTPATCTGTETYCAMTGTCVPPGTCEDMPKHDDHHDHDHHDTPAGTACASPMTICGKTKTCMTTEDCDNMPTMPTGMRRKLADGVECSVHAHCASGYCHTPQCFMSASKSAECKKLCMEKSWWSKSDKASITN